MKANEIKADEILDQAAQRLKSKGVDEDHLERLTVPNDTGVANDLLVMGQAKTYDAILVGRRGASRLREWVMGSVTANLVAHSKVIPIWVVDCEIHTTKVLLAADGSRPSLTALDHMAFMLSGDSNQKIHVLHVQPRFQDYCVIEAENDTARNAEEALQDGDRHCMRDFYTQALTVLEKNGIDPSRLDMETLGGNLSVSRTIVEYARKHQFGTIVLGRSGGSGNLFTGSVSSNVINRARDAALWVVP
jgi:nucleotide-binding universal stress UspA family protein